MKSLYQIRSKILHGMKVIIFGEKIGKELARPGFELVTFVLEDKGANHGSLMIYLCVIFYNMSYIYRKVASINAPY